MERRPNAKLPHDEEVLLLAWLRRIEELQRNHRHHLHIGQLLVEGDGGDPVLRDLNLGFAHLGVLSKPDDYCSRGLIDPLTELPTDWLREILRAMTSKSPLLEHLEADAGVGGLRALRDLPEDPIQRARTLHAYADYIDFQMIANAYDECRLAVPAGTGHGPPAAGLPGPAAGGRPGWLEAGNPGGARGQARPAPAEQGPMNGGPQPFDAERERLRLQRRAELAGLLMPLSPEDRDPMNPESEYCANPWFDWKTWRASVPRCWDHGELRAHRHALILDDEPKTVIRTYNRFFATELQQVLEVVRPLMVAHRIAVPFLYEVQTRVDLTCGSLLSAHAAGRPGRAERHHAEQPG